MISNGSSQSTALTGAFSQKKNAYKKTYGQQLFLVNQELALKIF